jgi:hypothetical protein
MFRSCTSLTTAPVLSATTLVMNCYEKMFANCSSLNEITMLATNMDYEYDSHYPLLNWVTGVPGEGIFKKRSQMDDLETGVSGIPQGWNVVNI